MMKQNSISKGPQAYIIPALTATLFLILIGITVFSIRYQTQQVSGDAMASDITLLASIFEEINRDCKILSFDYQQNPINFLNVRSFSGSEVGPMNLGDRQQWKGPYLEDNPTIQDKEYQVVRTHKGYFITPGNGVTLPNGKTIGKDIILNEDADIIRMMFDDEYLYYQGTPLAAPILMQKGMRMADIEPLAEL